MELRLICLLTLVQLAMFHSVYSQDDQGAVKKEQIEFKVINYKYVLDVPLNNFDLENSNNKESYTKQLKFANNSYLIINAGVQLTKPLIRENIRLLGEKKDGALTSRWGLDENNLHWREDNYSLFTLAFMNVNEDDLKAFNACLNNLKKKIIDEH